MVNESTQMSQRFRGFLPVVVDVETGGFNENTDALLQTNRYRRARGTIL
jgi:ribonuclease T